MSELLTNDVWQKKNKLSPRAIAIPTFFKHKVYDMINLDGTTVSFKSSASQKRRSMLERSKLHFYFFLLLFLVS